MTKRPKNDQGKNGNTIHSSRSRNYFFTLNNPVKNDKDLLINFFNQKGQYLFQLEKGKEGTLHYQGIVMMNNKISFTTLLKLNPKIHWEKARNKKACITYCSKDDTHIEGERYTNIQLPQKLIDPMENKILYKFQDDILALIKEKPDDRKIYWFWDNEGCSGKTTLAKHICIKNPNKSLYVSGKANDIKYAVQQFIEKNGNNLNIVIFGLPRTYEDYVSYDAIESIKDGIFFSGKFKGGMVMFNQPHIIILANFAPNTNKLSKDRCVIEEIEIQNNHDKKQ